MKNNPPIYVERFFAWVCHSAHLEGLEGDLYELFDEDLKVYGVRKARRRYLMNVLTLMRPSVIRNILKTQTNMDTFFHYLKSSFRTTVRNKGFSAVSLAGLVFAFTASILVGLYTYHETQYDEFRSNKNSVHRIYNVRYGDDGPPRELPIVPPKYSASIGESFPQAKHVGRVLNDYGGSFFKIGDKGFEEENGFFAEPSILPILDIKLIAGSPEGFDAVNTVILSEELYRKFFGDQEFKDQTLTVGRHEVKVLGIYENIPQQSHIAPDYIFSFDTAVGSVTEERMNSWIWQQFYTYVELNKDQDPKLFELQFQEYVEKEAHPLTKPSGFHYVPHLQGVTDIYLHSSSFNWEMAKRGNYRAIVFLNIAVGILLLIALFNFVNLFSVQTIKKLKEYSIRRTVGAIGNQISTQLFVHASSYVFAAIGVSILLAYLSLPSLELFLGENMSFSVLWNWKIISLIIVGIFGIVFLCTLYPMIIASRFKPADTLKGVPKLNSSRLDPRMIMVGIQYVLSIGLIFSSLVIQQQYNLLREKDMGFNPDQLVSIALNSGITNNATTVKNELIKHANIETISICYGTPGGIIAGDGVILPHEDNREASTNMIIADHDYIKTMGIEIIAGRDFHDSEVDVRESFIINETAVEKFGYSTVEEALEKDLHWYVWGSSDSIKRGKVVGVVKDFNFKSLHNEITPMVLNMAPDYSSFMIVRMGSGDVSGTIAYLEEWWKESGSERPLQYEFVDDLFAKEYHSEQQLNSTFMALTLIAILMATIGIFSLVTYNVNARLKEISIRKVLGAQISSLIRIVTMEYVVLSLIAMGIALPVCTLLLKEWLSEYAFRIEINMISYFVVALITLTLTFLIIGSQAWKAAVQNPVKNLRSE